jgi:hypothetical protein
VGLEYGKKAHCQRIGEITFSLMKQLQLYYNNLSHIKQFTKERDNTVLRGEQ